MALSRLLEGLPAGTLQAVVCPEDKSDPRSAYDGFLSLARQHRLDFHIVETVKATTELIKRYKPHTVLVHGWYRIIPVQEFPTIDFLGFHYSPLPSYRGNAPLVWQIINGERRLGVSFFQLSAAMDDGHLLDQRTFDLASHEDIADAIRYADIVVAEMLGDFIPKWLSGDVPRRPQPLLPASYCGLRTPADGRIDWRCTVDVLHNFVRAQARPYPGAFSRLPDGRVVRFWKCLPEERKFYGVPGAVVDANAEAITVACGDGALRVFQIEIEGQAPGTDLRALSSLKVRFV